ncbi:DNA polymerase III subunit alpha [Facklamia lactis]|uniref:DNA polymerase III subunit alpha n=1 Tax=Facklamia lactis TaxID=2749967 RepID=UPI0018CE53EB|nr:DNA polymerase III subunit alpha [Facklamia lactis]MBG9979830.1 DNA polymerase III subunit alpha [Facklamia lactis]
MLFNIRSAYSLLQSTISIEDYVRVAKERGYQAVGLADVNVLYGALDFYKRCRQEGLKPMVGMTLFMPGFVDQSKNFPLIVYCMNYQGYLSLIQLSKAILQESISVKKVKEILFTGRNHLLMISGGRSGELEQALIYEDYERAQEVLRQWKKIFKKENIYLGLSIYPFNEFECKQMMHFSKDFSLPIVSNQLVECLESEEAFSLKILQAIDRNEVLDDSIFSYRGAHYLYPKSDLEQMYIEQGLTPILENSQELKNRIQLELPLEQSLLPKFPVTHHKNSLELLKELTHQALIERKKDQNPDYLERLTHELEIISSMDFIDYFLIVWEIMDYCHNNGIRTGPGRGSAAGSLVAFLLNITLVDPIEYGLLFERFLNPERHNMPDIDIDIPDDKRDQVLLYIEKRYGHQQVAQMITFGSFGAKQSIRDTLRVLGKGKAIQDRWSKAIPNEVSISLETAYQKSSTLRQILNENQQNQQIFLAAKTIEGLPRHTSTHASGVVIADQDLSQWIPIIERPNQLQITQFAMEDVESVGLLKMDFLGLRNLQLLDDILNNIRIHRKENLNINQIDMNNRATLQLFQKADTAGVFQFESPGIRQVLKKLKPESFEDIIAVNALYRPGPMQQIDHFIARKHGKEKIIYLHPALEPILDKTYGIIVYQEQVMKICQELANFSLGQADLLRRAMGKKDIAIMNKEKEHFIAGALSNNIPEEIAVKIYDYIYQFANYGFNRAHAAVYSTLAYQLAYLKCHYPLEFYLSLLNQGRSLHQSNDDYVRAAKNKLGKFLPVNINKSAGQFTIENQKIRIGLMAVKGLRHDFCQAILSDRSLAGPYSDYQNFLNRLPKKFLKENLIQLLIKSGALDVFGYSRSTLSENLDHLIQFRIFSGNNLNLLEEIEPKIEHSKEWPYSEKLQGEREVLGFQLAGHPIDEYLNLIKNDGTWSQIEEILLMEKGKKIKLLAFIVSQKVIETKNQELMAFVTVNDGQQDISLVLFPAIYRRYQNAIFNEGVVAIEGKIDFDRQTQKQIIVQRVQAADQLNLNKDSNHIQSPHKLYIRLLNQDTQQIEALKTLALENPGPLEIFLVDPQRNAWQLDPQYNISAAKRIIQRLYEIFGNDNVFLK